MASIMSDFYATSLPCISSKSILDAQNAMKSIANQDGLDRLLASNADVKALYEIPSAHDTLDAVISSGAGDGKKRASFQGGMLTECVFADYLARVLGANATYVNCDQEDISRYANVVNAVTERVPRALPRFMMQSADGRTTIVQLGGPNATDCAIVGDGRLLACCEFKDKTAKAGEFDLMKDEDGKLVADEKTLDEMMEQMPSIIPIIDDFNANDSLHNHIGHNIKLSEAEQRKIFHDYIHRGQIDAIMTFGKDFTFVGNQYHLEKFGVEQFPDLLFYNRELACLVVVELKDGPFQTSFLGQLAGYLRILDDEVRKPNENPSIGIILCKSANKKFVEYVIQDYNRPMGVATYKTSADMDDKLKKLLPPVDALEKLL